MATTRAAGTSSAISTAMATITRQRMRSRQIISRTRSNRSASTPPYALNNSAGTKRQTAATATQPVEPVASMIHTTSATL